MPRALDKTYDGIVIGAGHHGLILGSYLAKAGLDIGGHRHLDGPNDAARCGHDLLPRCGFAIGKADRP